MIKLRIANHPGSIWINPYKIRLIDLVSNGTVIVFDMQHRIIVEEEPEQILKLIGEHNDANS